MQLYPGTKWSLQQLRKKILESLANPKVIFGLADFGACAEPMLRFNSIKGEQKKPLQKFFVFNLFYIIHKDQFKYLYDTIYTIGYYSCFYSSLRDQICANGGHFEFLP